MTDEAESTLGDRLLAGVTNLWKEVTNLGKVQDYHGQEIESLRDRMVSLERQIHGLKTSRGKALANNARLRATIDEASTKLRQVEDRLN